VPGGRLQALRCGLPGAGLRRNSHHGNLLDALISY
jgi:hypothetical protein